MADNNKENNKQQDKDKKMTKEERIANRNAPKPVEASEDDYSKGLYGNYPLIQSKEKVDRVLTNVADLSASLVDTKVWIRGRLNTSRKTNSNKLTYPKYINQLNKHYSRFLYLQINNAFSQ